MLEAFARAPFLPLGKMKLVQILLQNDTADDINCCICSGRIIMHHPLLSPFSDDDDDDVPNLLADEIVF